MKATFLGMLFFLFSNLSLAGHLFCYSGGFLYNNAGYEETDSHFLFSLSGQSIGYVNFNRFSDITIRGYSEGVLLAFKKENCTLGKDEYGETIHCRAATTNKWIDPKIFFVQRNFKTFDEQPISFIAQQSADILEVNFSRAEMTMNFTNAELTGENKDNEQRLGSIMHKECFESEAPLRAFPDNLRAFIKEKI